jgi:hypothetical protein
MDTNRTAIFAQRVSRQAAKNIAVIGAAKREYLLNSRARVYVRTGPFWRRHYWHCPV